MDNNKKNTADMNTNTKKSDRTAFADELNTNTNTTNNKQNQKHNNK